MGRYVALVRGINVGRAKRVGMEDLRQAFADLGFTEVRTLLNSGNVVFTSARRLAADSAERAEEAVRARTGVAARMILLTEGELRTILAECPPLEAATDPKRLLVAVTSTDAGLKKLEDLARGNWAPETLTVGRRAGYIWSPEGVVASALFRAVDRELGDEVTTRNWSTFTKLTAALGM